MIANDGIPEMASVENISSGNDYRKNENLTDQEVDKSGVAQELIQQENGVCEDEIAQEVNLAYLDESTQENVIKQVDSNGTSNEQSKSARKCC